MLPFILPQSKLHLRYRDDGWQGVQKGDIVCYLGQGKEFVAHRVVGENYGSTKTVFFVKGDAQTGAAKIDDSAIVAVVEKVIQPFFSYRTRGLFGTAIASAAIRMPGITRLLAQAVRSAIVLNRHFFRFSLK